MIEWSKSLVNDIIEKPTIYAFDYFRHVLPVFQNKAEAKLLELHEQFKPELNIELITSNVFLISGEKSIRLQFTISNKPFAQPAQNIEFFSNNFKISLEYEHKAYIKGGSTETATIKVRLSQKQIESKAFSFDLNTKYSYKDTPKTVKEELLVNEFSVSLSDEKEFVEIYNPYTKLDSGSAVKDESMFYGRDKFIEDITKLLIDEDGNLLRSHTISLYGQKRAGKSSILYHLKLAIAQKSPNSILVDLGNIEKVLGGAPRDSVIPNLKYSILDEIKDQIKEKFPALASLMAENILEIPVDAMLTENHAALFNAFMGRFNKLIGKSHNIILFIDEFTYIYQRIKRNELSENFMQFWKAMIQDFEFVGIIVGQDYMGSFIAEFPNPFGTCQNKPVTYLSEDEASKLICEPIQIMHSGGIPEDRYKSARAVKSILELSAGSAYYIVKICNALVNYLNEKHSPYIVEADVNFTVNNILIHGNAGIDEIFDPLYNDEGDFSDKTKSDDNLTILKIIAQKSQKDGYCFEKDIVCEDLSKERIDYLIDALVKRDVLEMKNNSYKIKVGLFKAWLLYKFGR
jgi:hypothetical protein